MIERSTPRKQTLSVLHLCGCTREYQVTGPPETLAGLKSQLSTKHCGRGECPRKRRRPWVAR